jgi:hypothetical protein
LTVTQVERSGRAADIWRAAGKENAGGVDINHIVDLQLGGYDEIGNMSPARQLGEPEASARKSRHKPGNRDFGPETWSAE